MVMDMSVADDCHWLNADFDDFDSMYFSVGILEGSLLDSKKIRIMIWPTRGMVFIKAHPYPVWCSCLKHVDTDTVSCFSSLTCSFTYGIICIYVRILIRLCVMPLPDVFTGKKNCLLPLTCNTWISRFCLTTLGKIQGVFLPTRWMSNGSTFAPKNYW